ncbi:MAG: gliding motility-associated C-terminal domain-containing protein, partial [Flavobacteriales bacterium]
IDYVPNTMRIDVNDMSQFATGYNYTFGDGNTSNLSNPVYSYRDTGDFLVWQYVTNDFGCRDSISKEIYIQFITSYVPNAFTPNKDGLNEVFMPVVSGHNPEKYEFTVYNKWGEMIFRSKSNTEGWDGTFNGIESPNGIYVWTLVTSSKVGTESFVDRGHVTLVR